MEKKNFTNQLNQLFNDELNYIKSFIEKNGSIYLIDEVSIVVSHEDNGYGGGECETVHVCEIGLDNNGKVLIKVVCESDDETVLDVDSLSHTDLNNIIIAINRNDGEDF